MRNLWIFISKYNAFFLFLIFFIFSIILLLRNNSYQRASVWNSANDVIGGSYERVNNFRDYLSLGKVNDSLAAEIARLKNEARSSFLMDSVSKKIVVDSVRKRQYLYTEARVVNNSVNQKNNFITINRGALHGISKGDGVICADGVVGIVLDVSAHYATIKSLLNSATKVTAGISGNTAPGSLIWGIGNFDPKVAILQDIPNHIPVRRGDMVVTNEYSTVFPPGIVIGTVTGISTKGGASFPDILVRLRADFATLNYVYVVKNLLGTERTQLEVKTNPPGVNKQDNE